MAGKRSRSYSIKKQDIIAYKDVAERVEQLREEAGWQDDDVATAQEKFEGFFDAACEYIGSEGKSDDEIEDIKQVLDNLTDMAPGLDDSKKRELMKYCHRQAMYDTFVEPIESKVQPLMNGEDLKDVIPAFHEAIQSYGQTVFDDMDRMVGSLERMNRQWDEDEGEINEAIKTSQSTMDKIKERIDGFNLTGLKETATEKMAHLAATGGDVAGTAKKGFGKALAIITRRKSSSEKFDELFEQATEVVSNFRAIKAEMRTTQNLMQNVVENKLEPLFRETQNLKAEQMEIIRKLDYQIEAGKEMERVFTEEIIPELEEAEKEADELDAEQLDGFKEIRKGYKKFLARLTLLSAQKQEAAALTQALDITGERFQDLMDDANTYNNVTSISMRRTMNTLELTLDNLDYSIQAAKRNDLANDLFENIIKVTELGQEIQSKTNISVDPQKVLEVRKRMSAVKKQRFEQERVAIASHKSQMKLLEAVDNLAKATENLELDDSDEALRRQKAAEEAVEKAEKEAESAKKDAANNIKRLTAKPDETKGKFNSNSKPSEKPSGDAKSAEPEAGNDNKKSASYSKFAKKSDNTPK